MIMGSSISHYFAEHGSLLEITNGKRMPLTNLLTQLEELANQSAQDIVRSVWWQRLRTSILIVIRLS
jgi:hypothetical protein